MKQRASGILLHITSLPSKYGVGDLGPAAYKFADFLAGARQRYWQVLPLSPTSCKSPYSPYNSTSVFGGNTLLISPELLYREGLLTAKDLRNGPDFPKARVDYRLVNSYKTKLMGVAYGRFRSGLANEDYERFCSENAFWLENYALFSALSGHFGTGFWCDWPTELRDRKNSAVNSAKCKLKETIDREKFVQYVFFKQWFALKNYCNEKSIGIIGDIPFYVAYDSADVWANPNLFKLTKTRRPRFVGGVPPDLFSWKGQLWKSPVYNWQALEKTGYKWWIERIKHNLLLFDFVRLDHFRGFAAYWQVPANHKTARNGRWIKGPGEDFFNVIVKHFPASSLIAEDLGYITPEIKKLIEKFKLACMRVLLFAFDGKPATNSHLPCNHIPNCVVYTGTHDNNTVKGWFEKEANSEQKKNLFAYLGGEVSTDRLHQQLIRLAMSSVAKTVIIPMQDVLGLGDEGRMNRPGTVRGNWSWRLGARQIRPSIVRNLEKLTETHGRADFLI